ncbi:MAG: transglycosylase domain-containing protein [Candidatus Saccharimonadales bacterium]
MNEAPRPRRSKYTHVTRSGKSIKINQSLGDRRQATKAAKANRKAAYLSSLPPEPWKRLLYRLHPKRLYKYWFSREGGLMALKIAGIGFVVGFLIIVGVFAYFRKDLPKIKDVSGNNFGGSVTYYDRTGQTVLFQDYNDKKRVPVTKENIADYMRQATISIEDKNFYKHGAFDTRGITRAIIHDLSGKGGTQGGSTITQQLVKLNEGWTDERTVSRKVKELILAVELEREYSKDEILNGYLNMAPYGNVNYGVETAAQDYFGVSAKQLSLAQAAMLASIPKAPGSLSPYSSPKYNPALTADYFNAEALIHRQHYVLDQMESEGYITKKQSDEAKKVDILAQVKPRKNFYDNIKAPYFVLAAKSELNHLFPTAVVRNGGWKVITTVDLRMQALADKAMNDGRATMRARNADVGAFVAEDNDTGQILAVVGGWGLDTPGYGENNYATDVNISPGSTVKPYDYAAFIDNNSNVGAGSVLYDKQTALPGWPCTNKALPSATSNGGNCLFDFDRRYPGPMTIRYALGGSRNVPAVKAFLSSVPNDTSAGRTESAKKTMSVINGLMQGRDGYRCFKEGADVTTATKALEAPCGGSAGIGDGAYLHLDEHVNGIASISRMGKAIPKTYILKVTNSAGKTLREFKQPVAKQIIKPDTAYIVNDMASDYKASYLSGSCNEQNCYGMRFHRSNGWKIAIKTGTTNDLMDGLMVSWSKKISAGVWVGNHSRTVPYNGQPEYMTDPIMRQFMTGAHALLGKADNWVAPASIKTAPAYVNTTRYTGSQIVPSASTDLYPSWYTGQRSGSTTQTLDKVSNKVATSCTPELAKQTSANSNSATWNVDVFAGGSTGSKAPVVGNDDVHNCNDTKPSVRITLVNNTVVGNGTLQCPATGGCPVKIYVEQGTYPLSDSARAPFPGTLNLQANGQNVASQGVSATGDYTMTFTPPSGVTSFTLTAQVIDSVLYSTTDSTTVTKLDQPSSATPGSGNGANNPPGQGAFNNLRRPTSNSGA